MNQQLTLTRAIAEQINNDFVRLHELSQQTVVTPSLEAEISALQGNLAGALIQFGPELLSAWFLQKGEYEPMMGAFATILSRAQQINANRAAAVAARQQPAAANVIALK